MKTTEQLEMCPFCGETPEARTDQFGQESTGCDNQGCVMVGYRFTPAAWNRRAQPTAPSEDKRVATLHMVNGAWDAWGATGSKAIDPIQHLPNGRYEIRRLPESTDG